MCRNVKQNIIQCWTGVVKGKKSSFIGRGIVEMLRLIRIVNSKSIKLMSRPRDVVVIIFRRQPNCKELTILHGQGG